MKLIDKIQLMTLSIMLISSCSFGQLAGKSYITSNCASGGFDYYFFNNNTVVAECIGCVARPFVQTGTWEIKGNDVVVDMDKEWFGEGTGKVVGASNVSIYENYVARTGPADNYFTISIEQLQVEMIEGCEVFGVHEYSDSSPQTFLRNGLIGKYPETYIRFLTEDDLNDKSKQELRLMRNEIFARYGYKFKLEDLKTYFNKQNGYVEFGSDVDAFLSDIEKANVKLIQEYEKSE